MNDMYASQAHKRACMHRLKRENNTIKPKAALYYLIELKIVSLNNYYNVQLYLCALKRCVQNDEIMFE